MIPLFAPVANYSTALDKALLGILGSKDFEIIKKNVSKEDQIDIVKVGSSIEISNAWKQAFWLGNKNHETIYANPIYRQFTEYSLEECLGKQADFCFDEESKRRIAEQHKLRKKGISSQYEASYITKSGKSVPILIIGAPTESGGTYGIHINMTQTKELVAAKQITDQVIRYSTEAIIILDKNYNIKIWNYGASRLFGYKEEEVIDKNLDVLTPEDKKEETKAIFKQIISQKTIRNFETKKITKNQEVIDTFMSVTKVTGEKDKFIGYLVIFRDITQQKKTDIELQKRFEAIQDAYKELGLQKRQSEYLSEILEVSVSKEGIDNLAKLIVSAACMLTKCDGTVLRLYEKSTDTLRLEACLGVNHQWLSKDKIYFKNSIAEDAFENKRPSIFQNVDSLEKHKGLNLIKAHKFKVLILIPLFVENTVIGSLSLYATDPAKFRLIETDFLEKFGKQCSVGLFTKMATQTTRKVA